MELFIIFFSHLQANAISAPPNRPLPDYSVPLLLIIYLASRSKPRGLSSAEKDLLSTLTIYQLWYQSNFTSSVNTIGNLHTAFELDLYNA
jgi:hypothetical protein